MLNNNPYTDHGEHEEWTNAENAPQKCLQLLCFNEDGLMIETVKVRWTWGFDVEWILGWRRVEVVCRPASVGGDPLFLANASRQAAVVDFKICQSFVRVDRLRYCHGNDKERWAATECTILWTTSAVLYKQYPTAKKWKSTHLWWRSCLLELRFSGKEMYISYSLYSRSG